MVSSCKWVAQTDGQAICQSCLKRGEDLHSEIPARSSENANTKNRVSNDKNSNKRHSSVAVILKVCYLLLFLVAIVFL